MAAATRPMGVNILPILVAGTNRAELEFETAILLGTSVLHSRTLSGIRSR